jgi:hypothetical protein
VSLPEIPEAPASGVPRVNRDEALEKSAITGNIAVSLSQYHDCLLKYSTFDAINLPEDNFLKKELNERSRILGRSHF